MAVVATRGIGIDADALIGPAAYGLGATGAVVAFGNHIFATAYNMIHPVHEDAVRGPTSASEPILRKRDKKPIIIGGGDG